MPMRLGLEEKAMLYRLHGLIAAGVIVYGQAAVAMNATPVAPLWNDAKPLSLLHLVEKKPAKPRTGEPVLKCEKIKSTQCKADRQGKLYDCQTVDKTKCTTVSGPGSAIK